MHYTGNYKVNFTSGYAHAWHIILLKALFDVTGEKQLLNYYKRFKSYCDDDFFSQHDKLWREEP